MYKKTRCGSILFLFFQDHISEKRQIDIVNIQVLRAYSQTIGLKYLDNFPFTSHAKGQSTINYLVILRKMKRCVIARLEV